MSNTVVHFLSRQSLLFDMIPHSVPQSSLRPASSLPYPMYSTFMAKFFFRHGRRNEPKFGTHVRIDTLTLKKIDPPNPRGFRGLLDVVPGGLCDSDQIGLSGGLLGL